MSIRGDWLQPVPLAGDSVSVAHEVASGLSGDAAAQLVTAANQAFVDAMSATASIAAAVALLGALIAARFLPARQKAASEPAAPATVRRRVPGLQRL